MKTFIFILSFLAANRPLTAEDAAKGRAVYARECSACHGERGRGDGPAAAFLEVPPRDFTKGLFKFRTTPSGEPPATADVLRVIERGVMGSAMPAFDFLSEAERRQVAAYVLELADLLESPEPEPVRAPPAPPVSTASIARGKQVYAEQGCQSCHGEKGRGDGPSARLLRDDEGRPIRVRDFTSGLFRGGNTREDLYYRFVTGMDGSPMPSFAETVQGDDRWALVDYVMSLRVGPVKAPLPNEPIQAGRALAAKYACRGCHVLDDGKGGDVGPDLRVSAKKLRSEWVRSFLSDVRAYGKIYPWRPHRMPDLKLEPAEVDALVGYLAAMRGKRSSSEPDPAAFSQEMLDLGRSLFPVRCAECHALGRLVETPPIKQQGPDLVHVAGRIDYDWAKQWILDPRKLDPKTRMTVPGITPEQAEALRQFIWKVSRESGGAPGSR